MVDMFDVEYSMRFLTQVPKVVGSRRGIRQLAGWVKKYRWSMQQTSVATDSHLYIAGAAHKESTVQETAASSGPPLPPLASGLHQSIQWQHLFEEPMALADE